MSERFARASPAWRSSRATGRPHSSATVADQSQLFGLLERVRSLGLELIRVEVVCRVSALDAATSASSVRALRRGDEDGFQDARARVPRAAAPARARVRAQPRGRGRGRPGDVARRRFAASRASRAVHRCKTWIFRILANTAKTRAEREGRTVPLSALRLGRRRPVGRPVALLRPAARALAGPLGEPAGALGRAAGGAPRGTRDARRPQARDRRAAARRRSR